MKKTITFSLLTILLIIFIIVAGIPLLVRLATFIADIKSSGELTEKQDSIPPFPPKLRPLPIATNINSVTIKGFAEAGAVVKIMLNGETVKEVIAEADGSFMAEGLILALGKNKIKTIAIDQADNQSQESGSLLIEYDKTAPELEITSPKDKSSLSGDNRQVIISGKTEPGVILKINTRLIILGPEGEFEHSLTLSEGENSLVIQAQDPAGNQTEKSLTLTYSP